MSLLVAVSTTVYGRQPWPSVSEVAASGRGWHHLSDLGLSAQELTGVQRTTVGWLDKHCKHDTEKIGTFPAERVQLRANGASQLVVTAVGDWEGDSQSCPCEPNLNCRNWILEFSQNGANTLLEYGGNGIVVLKSSSHGYFDIATSYNQKATMLELRIWRFDGKRYQALRCASVHYSRKVMNDPSKVYEEIDRTGVISEHACR